MAEFQKRLSIIATRETLDWAYPLSSWPQRLLICSITTNRISSTALNGVEQHIFRVRRNGGYDAVYMTKEAFPMTTSNVEVLIHVNDALDEAASRPLLASLRETAGVTQVRFNPRQGHLVLVGYDPRTTSSRELLDSISKHGHRAQLIGL
jgi:hypothetical protein